MDRMLTRLLTSVVALASVVAAHFSIEYPEERGDSFATGASQWIYPCANVNQTASTNRTLWPLSGGAVALDLHHPWTYVYINLGLGASYPTFNISLTPDLLNVTGNGTYCIPAIKLPTGLAINEGQQASVQVVTGGQSGSALYNCADITFTKNATAVSSEVCTNSTGVSAAIVQGAKAGSPTTSAGAAASSSKAASAGNTNSGSGMMGSAFIAGVGALAVSWLL